MRSGVSSPDFKGTQLLEKPVVERPSHCAGAVGPWRLALGAVWLTLCDGADGAAGRGLIARTAVLHYGWER